MCDTMALKVKETDKDNLLLQNAHRQFLFRENRGVFYLDFYNWNQDIKYN